MPSYDYKCATCDNLVTMVAGIKEQIKTPVCINCKGEMTRIYSAPPIQFKGQGFNASKG